MAILAKQLALKLILYNVQHMVTSSQAKRIIFPHLFLYLELRKSERKRSKLPHADAVCHHRDARGQLVSIDTWARDIRYGST